MKSILRIAGAAALMVSTQAAAQDVPDRYILAGNLIPDAETGAIGPAVIAIKGGKILSVTRGTARPDASGVPVTDLSSQTVLPGLIDLHVHLTGDPGGEYWREAVEPEEWGVVVGTKNALVTAKAGFTTVREAGSAPQTAFVLRRGTADGIIPGPRIVAAGPALSIVGGHGDINGFREDVNDLLSPGFTCTGPVECAERVRRASRAGSDVIKITATGGVLSQQGRGLESHFSDDELKSIADTAHSLGLRVMAHAHGARGAEAASRAGIDTIDHGTFVDEQALRVMKANGTALVPTLMALESVNEKLGKGIYTPVVENKIRMTTQFRLQSVRKARQLGVTVAFGTDAGVFDHGRNAQEFALLVEAGMSAKEAIASATTVAAAELGLEGEIGRIAPGYSADIIAVSGNPLSDVRQLEAVDWVMVRGRVID